MKDLPEHQVQKFVEEYRSTVAIPHFRGKQFLLCPIGIIGSGKTTVMKPLAEKLGLVRISTDEIRKILKENHFNYNKAEDITFAVLNFFANRKFGVAMDADCVRQEKTKKIEELAAKLKIPIIWIHINPPEEFILNKLKNFQHTWLFKDAEDAIRNYEVRKQLHKNLHSDFAYTFDPSRSDLTDQIEEAISIIKRGMSVTL